MILDDLDFVPDHFSQELKSLQGYLLETEQKIHDLNADSMMN